MLQGVQASQQQPGAPLACAPRGGQASQQQLNLKQGEAEARALSLTPPSLASRRRTTMPRWKRPKPGQLTDGTGHERGKDERAHQQPHRRA